MPDVHDEIFGRAIQEIARTVMPIAVRTGTVVSLDTAAMTCSVQLTDDEPGTPTPGVTLNVVRSNSTGAYGIPKKGAHCIVAELDGTGKWELLKASEYDTVIARAKEVVLTLKSNKVSIRNGSVDFATWMRSLIGHIKSITVMTDMTSTTPLNSADFTSDLNDFNKLFF